MGALINMTGQKFAKLTVLAMLPNWRCLCLCECGTEFDTQSYNLRKGLTKSCGCLRLTGDARRTHGESAKGKWTAEYRTWVNINTRCHNPKATRYENWGGRGIKVCDEWRKDFQAFLNHMGRRPSSEHSIDRIDNSGNYEPGNVRWATRSEQARNTRPHKKGYKKRARNSQGCPTSVTAPDSNGRPDELGQNPECIAS